MRCNFRLWSTCVLAWLLTLSTVAFAQEKSEDSGSAEANSAPSGDDDGYQLPDDLDDIDGDEEDGDDYQLPDDLDDIDDDKDGDDYELPDDLDDEDEDEDEDEAEDDGPVVLPVFGETTFSLTSTSVLQYRFDNFNANMFDDNFFAFWERLEVAMQGEALRLTARIDAFLPLATSDCPDELSELCFLKADLRLERLTAHYEADGYSVDIGDSYAVLGRGMGLSLRRVDQLGIDVSLRGGHIAYKGKSLYFRALAGSLNPQNLDPQTLRIIENPEDRLRGSLFSNPERHDWVVGAEAGGFLPGQSFKMGLHALHVWFAPNEATRRRAQVTVGGTHISAPSLADGKLALYAEFDLMDRSIQTFIDGELGEASGGDTGRALYANAQLQAGNGTFLLELKDYRNFLVADSPLTGEAWRIYGSAPPLESDYERFRSIHNSRGGRLQYDYGFLPGPWGISAAALVYAHAEDPDVDPFDGILVTQGMAKVQRINDSVDSFGWSFDAQVRYRRESYLKDPDAAGVLQSGDLDWQVVHLGLELGFAFGKHSLELSAYHRFERRYSFDYVNYVRGSSSLTWSFAGKFRISPVLNWNTEKIDTPSLYPGIEARWDFIPGSFLRIFGGRTPGGRICSGGVCRDVPEFEGILGEVVVRL